MSKKKRNMKKRTKKEMREGSRLELCSGFLLLLFCNDYVTRNNTDQNITQQKSNKPGLDF